MKFRIWDKSCMLWLHEDSQYLVMDGSKVLSAPWGTVSFTTNDKNFVIQRYTGLKDKNNKEIYEGDILQFRDYSPVEVKYGQYSLDHIKYIGFFLEGRGDNGIYINMLIKNPKNFMIIGNIFENKELLV